RPARGIDEDRRRLHARELGGADEATGPLAEDEMDRHDIRGGEKRLLGHQLHACLCGALGGEIWAPGGDLHPERLADRRDLRPEPPEPNDAERLPLEAAAEGRLPEAGAHRAVLAHDVAAEREDETP